MDDPVNLLNQAVEVVRGAGMPCDGWTLQASDEGFVAWLFVEDAESQRCLFEGVDILPSAAAAAHSALVRASDLAEP